MNKGKLIVFEGISGTGKETQAKLLQMFLRKHHITSQIVFHPSPQLKLILDDWRKKRNIDTLTEVYLLLADRYDCVRRLVVPALKRGEWVIGLRNYVSALVYQGKTEEERTWIAQEFKRFEPVADALFLFDIIPEDAMARVMRRHNETGESLGKFETPVYLKEKRERYLTVLQHIPYIRVDASRSIDEIQNTILHDVNFLL